MAANRKSWKDLNGRTKARIIFFGVVQLALQGIALADLKKRPSAQVKGPKIAWVAASFINFAGPITYLVWGRKK